MSFDEPDTVARAMERRLTPEALKAFAHPLRIAMYEYLAAHGSATASQLARATGESTGQTSYHLRQLERHGFIEDDPERTGGRERWWRTIGFAMDSSAIDDPATKVAAQIMLDTVASSRAEELTRWFAVAPTLGDEWTGKTLNSRSTAELTRDELGALTDALSALVDQHLDAAKATRAAERAAGAADPERRRVRVYIDAFPLALDEPR